jgi:hypothetical protein
MGYSFVKSFQPDFLKPRVLIIVNWTTRNQEDFQQNLKIRVLVPVAP